MNTERSGRAHVERCDEKVELWAPRLGIVNATRTWRVCVPGDAEDHEWHVLERDGDRALVLERVASISGAGWSRFTARVWEAPAWVHALEERLGADADLRRVRTVLLAGVTPATPLFDVYDGPPDEDEERWTAWRPCDPDALSELLTASAGAALERLAERDGLELEPDGAALTTLAAACASGAEESNGVPVIGLELARTVSAIRFAGAPALLVASVTAVDDQPLDDVLAARAPDLRVVPFTGAEHAAEVVLQQAPGLALPDAGPPRGE